MENMTKQRLEEYKSKKEEIEELRHKLQHLGEGDSLIGNDVIMDYRDGYPKPRTVIGKDYKKEERLRNLWEKRKEKLEKEVLEVELWIEDISDSVTRRIFRMRYMDGLAQEQVATKIHTDRSTVSRKVDNYLKVAHKTQKTHL